MSNPLQRWLYLFAVIIIIIGGIIIIIIPGHIPRPGGCPQCGNLSLQLVGGINILAGIGILLTARKLNQQQRY
ncbi:hypothetical protein [Chitinophaga dinghuensis]|uniref:hypothetical protein n=1 Tax=Chitinophaga dinghuensis TaxID=1539050 RepID=UPI0011B94481|nr:hypothetical protein [Chitinophaga dinghuensis]